jgi:Phage integrase family
VDVPPFQRERLADAHPGVDQQDRYVLQWLWGTLEIELLVLIGQHVFSVLLSGQQTNSRHPIDMKLPRDFVLHSLRHTCLTRLGLSGADAFTIMRFAGHSTITVSQRYVHPTPEAMENAVARMEAMNRQRVELLETGESQGATTFPTTPGRQSLVSH